MGFFVLFFRSSSYCWFQTISSFGTPWTWGGKDEQSHQLSFRFWPKLLVFTGVFKYIDTSFSVVSYLAWCLHNLNNIKMWHLLTSDFSRLMLKTPPVGNLRFLRVWNQRRPWNLDFWDLSRGEKLALSTSSGMSSPAPPPKASSQFFGLHKLFENSPDSLTPSC